MSAKPDLQRRDCLRQVLAATPLSGALLAPLAGSLAGSLLATQPAQAQGFVNNPPRQAPAMQWPRDHGAHLGHETEWWSLKGELYQGSSEPLGFCISFMRSRIEAALQSPSRFAPKHVLGGRASVSDVERGMLHDQRAARIGLQGFGASAASGDDLALVLEDWTLTRSGPQATSVFSTHIEAQDVVMALRATATQPVLIHGERGFARQEPSNEASSYYYSLPYLKLDGKVTAQGKHHSVSGRAWLDHGWGKSQEANGSDGTDWVGIHLNDGSALMVSRMRSSEGRTVWENATLRQPGKPDLVYKHEDIRMTPVETWRSPNTGAVYPVVWRIELAGTTYTVKARNKNQEMDGGSGVGDVFWEGLAELLDSQGRVLGLGFLEMAGYVVDKKPA
jgi:predicted secreted hydrolase